MKDLKFTWITSPHNEMILIKGVILGHYISAVEIQVDPEKIEVILLLATPCS